MKGLHRLKQLFLLNSLLLLLLQGCRGNSEIEQLRKENTRLKAEIEQLKASQQRATEQPTPVPTPSATPLQVDVAYEDTAGIFGEKEINQLGQLGVFDTTIGKFNPQQVITRAEFVRWLLRANNAIWFDQADKLIREAEGGDATFADVPPTDLGFRYIQGMANAGFMVGSTEKLFQPEQPLTREEMLAMKLELDIGGVSESPSKNSLPNWSDRNKISKKFLPFFQAMYTGQNDLKNVERTYGAVKTLKPQAPVTRAEAAVCISAIGNHTLSGQANGNFRTAETALQLRLQPPTP
jgi:hypothetical protein